MRRIDEIEAQHIVNRRMNNVLGHNKFIVGLNGALNVVHSPVNNVFCFDFINLPKNQCLFYQSLANVMHILEITCKEIVYIAGYQS